MADRVKYERSEKVAIITLDDGKRNALSREMLTELDEALSRAESDRVAVLLTGREGVFSAGFDLNTVKQGGEACHRMFMQGFEVSARLLSFPAPVVIASTGHALAMGSFLLLSSDFRVGAGGAFKIGANEVAIGLVMPHFGVEICRQRLAPAYFHRSVINAEIYGPDEAADAGFLDRVEPPEELMSVALAKANELAKLDVKVHTATKLRAREQSLAAIRAAITKDDGIFRAMY